MRCAPPSLIVAILTVLACSSGERRQATSAADSVFIPRQYSVADFYRNTSYFGASFSPEADRILVSSNASGVCNAYAIPTAGGAPEALTKSDRRRRSSPSPTSRPTIESSTPATGAATSWTICTCACPTAARRTSRRGRSTRRSSPGGPATTARSSSHQRARPAVLRSLRVRHRRLRPEALLSQHRGLFPGPDLPRQALPRAGAPADLERCRHLPARSRRPARRRKSRSTRASQLLARRLLAGRQRSSSFTSDSGREFAAAPVLTTSPTGRRNAGVRAALGHPRRRATPRAGSI